jgi:hypothetical protein
VAIDPEEVVAIYSAEVVAIYSEEVVAIDSAVLFHRPVLYVSF